MLKLASLLSVGFVLVGAWDVRDTGECEVGQWSAWGTCGTNKDCSRSRSFDRSFAKPPAKWDQGRSAMQRMMRHKERSWGSQSRCVAAGGCADAQKRPTDGANVCRNGLAGDIPCLNVDQMSFINLYDLGYTKPHGSMGDPYMMGNDCWGWTDPETGDEFALMGISGGTSFVRITDPAKPVVVAFIYGPNGTEASPWRDIKVVDNHAYIVAEAMGHGLQVFDLTRLRGLQELEYLEPDSHYRGFGQAHNIVSNEETKFVYGVGSRAGNYSTLCAGGLYALDVSTPKDPRFAGCFGDDGYTHDAQCVIFRGHDERHYGKEICFAYNEDTLTIVDVSDKDNMIMLSKTTYTGAAYTHQGWLTEDHTTLLMDDELNELRGGQLTTYIWDVRNLEDPKLKRTYHSKVPSIDHNQYIVGNYVYQANYKSGLRVLYIHKKEYDLQEVAYFDAFPSKDEVAFGGLWNVYPFFPSGNVILSSIEYGLFVVRPDYDAMDNAVITRAAFAHRTRSRELISHPPGATCPPLVETRPCHTRDKC